MTEESEHQHNPFGLRPPFERIEAGPAAVYGYGDVTADFHLVGDHPGRHGGSDSGVPFAGRPALLAVVRRLGFVAGPPERPTLEGLFMNYRHPCRLPGDRSPTPDEYAACEPTFDAEVRAVNAHVLLPVGLPPTAHVLETYTTAAPPETVPHGESIHGRGFLVVPIEDPAHWGPTDGEAIEERIGSLLESDYRQTKGRRSR